MKLALKEDIYRIDKACFEQYGIPVIVLMENAGGAAYLALEENISCFKKKKYLIFCGPGNNGGDGAVLARKLYSEGVTVQVIFTDSQDKFKGEAKVNISILEKIGLPVLKAPLNPQEINILIRDADILIDAVFGTGFHGEVDEKTALIFDSINQSGKPVVSLDIPSGLSADGAAAAHSVKAGLTVTFGLPKLGMIDFPGRELSGKTIVHNINIPLELLEDPAMKNNLITEKDLEKIYTPRKRNTNKGTYGHLLLIGGSDDGSARMSGAVILAGTAALRTGAGLLSIAAPETVIKPVQKNLPEAMAFVLREKETPSSIQNLTDFICRKKIHTVLIGNGFGAGENQLAVIRSILENKTIDKLVIDADGLNNLAENPEVLEKLKAFEKEKILTPHIGEMARLVQKDIAWVKNNKIECARQFASGYNAIVVLKDAVSVIAAPDGNIYMSDRGSASLAKGGSGDILAGLIAGLAASGYTALNAGLLGTFILGRAGELYEEKQGSESALARDILDLTGDVFKELTSGIHSSSFKIY